MTNSDKSMLGIGSRSEELYVLCDKWVSGAIDHDAFRAGYLKAIFGQQAAAIATTDADRELRVDALTDEFNNAIRCALAVISSIDQIRLLGGSLGVPVAVRGYYFGKNLGDNDRAILACRRYCSLD